MPSSHYYWPIIQGLHTHGHGGGNKDEDSQDDEFSLQQCPRKGLQIGFVTSQVFPKLGMLINKFEGIKKNQN